jgi:hypothetical protein
VRFAAKGNRTKLVPFERAASVDLIEVGMERSKRQGKAQRTFFDGWVADRNGRLSLKRLRRSVEIEDRLFWEKLRFL